MLQKHHRNELLGALSAAELGSLLPHLQAVDLSVRERIQHRGEPLSRVVFPISGLLSVVAKAGDHQLEVAMVGREGMSGVPLLLGSEQATHECFVQVAGEGMAISADELKRAFAAVPSLRQRLLAYVEGFLAQIAETAVANGRCTVEERLARWLLMAQDRLGTDHVPLTHEFLAIMLGVRRPGITVALQVLEGEGAIRNVRGLVTLVKRSKLMQVARGSYHPLDISETSSIQMPATAP